MPPDPETLVVDAFNDRLEEVDRRWLVLYVIHLIRSAAEHGIFSEGQTAGEVAAMTRSMITATAIHLHYNSDTRETEFTVGDMTMVLPFDPDLPESRTVAIPIPREEMVDNDDPMDEGIVDFYRSVAQHQLTPEQKTAVVDMIELAVTRYPNKWVRNELQAILDDIR